MTASNDQSWMDSGENISLIARVRFLIAALKRYENEPSESAWSVVREAMQDLETVSCGPVDTANCSGSGA